MTQVKRQVSAYEIAVWLLEASELHEKSWVPGEPYGHYAKSITLAVNEVAPKPWGFIIALLLIGGWNDALDWAKTIKEAVDGPSD